MAFYVLKQQRGTTSLRGTATELCGEELGIGVTLRSQALLAEDSRADALYIQSVECLANTTIRPELARAHLLRGEWLRRQGRRTA